MFNIPCAIGIRVKTVLLCVSLSTPGFTFAQADSSLDADSFECIIEPLVTLELGSEVQGLIDELYVERGETVAKGDIVALLKSSVELRRVEQATKRAEMKGEITARTADLELARLVLDRSKSLHSQQLVPSQELDEARAQHRVATASLQQAEDNQEQLNLELLLAKSLLAQRVVRSPVDGVVVKNHAHAGEFVHDNPIATIAQLHPLRVEVVLPLAQYGRFQVGDPATIEPELGNVAIQGFVDVVDPLLDSGSGTFGLRILVNNESGDILAGQKCLAKLSGAASTATASADDTL